MARPVPVLEWPGMLLRLRGGSLVLRQGSWWVENMKVSNGLEVTVLVTVSNFAEGRVDWGEALESPDGVENGLWLSEKMGRSGWPGCGSGPGVCTGICDHALYTMYPVSETWVIQKHKYGPGFYLQLLVPEPAQESPHSVIAGVLCYYFWGVGAETVTEHYLYSSLLQLVAI